MNARGILELMKAAGRLKRTRRTGWVEAGVSDPESVADHTYRVALLSMALADSRGLDSHRAVGMALLHDLAEAVTGDLTPDQKPPDHAAYEAEAFRQVVGGLDPDQRSRYTGLFLEYVAGETPEAALVRAADKLDMALQAREYMDEGAQASNLGRFMELDLPEEYGALLSALKELGAG